jgi:hypothetical protein
MDNKIQVPMSRWKLLKQYILLSFEWAVYLHKYNGYFWILNCTFNFSSFKCEPKCILDNICYCSNGLLSSGYVLIFSYI